MNWKIPGLFVIFALLGGAAHGELSESDAKLVTYELTGLPATVPVMTDEESYLQELPVKLKITNGCDHPVILFINRGGVIPFKIWDSNGKAVATGAGGNGSSGQPGVEDLITVPAGTVIETPVNLSVHWIGNQVWNGTHAGLGSNGQGAYFWDSVKMPFGSYKISASYDMTRDAADYLYRYVKDADVKKYLYVGKFETPPQSVTIEPAKAPEPLDGVKFIHITSGNLWLLVIRPDGSGALSWGQGTPDFYPIPKGAYSFHEVYAKLQSIAKTEATKPEDHGQIHLYAWDAAGKKTGLFLDDKDKPYLTELFDTAAAKAFIYMNTPMFKDFMKQRIYFSAP